MPVQQEIESICEGTSRAFAESVLGAYQAIFEQETDQQKPQDQNAQQQKQDQTVAVNADSLVSSDNVEAIPGLLKNAQQAQAQADQSQQNADKAKQNLRDALAIPGNSQENQQNAQP